MAPAVRRTILRLYTGLCYSPVHSLMLNGAGGLTRVTERTGSQSGAAAKRRRVSSPQPRTTA